MKPDTRNQRIVPTIALATKYLIMFELFIHSYSIPKSILS